MVERAVPIGTLKTNTAAFWVGEGWGRKVVEGNQKSDETVRGLGSWLLRRQVLLELSVHRPPLTTTPRVGFIGPSMVTPSTAVIVSALTSSRAPVTSTIQDAVALPIASPLLAGSPVGDHHL